MFNVKPNKLVGFGVVGGSLNGGVRDCPYTLPLLSDRNSDISFNGNAITIPKTGKYRVYLGQLCRADESDAYLWLVINGTAHTTAWSRIGDMHKNDIDVTVELNKGDVIEFRWEGAKIVVWGSRHSSMSITEL